MLKEERFQWQEEIRNNPKLLVPAQGVKEVFKTPPPNINKY